jgi:hypothetical protein
VVKRLVAEEREPTSAPSSLGIGMRLQLGTLTIVGEILLLEETRVVTSWNDGLNGQAFTYMFAGLFHIRA